jgi:hypothetical protein
MKSLNYFYLISVFTTLLIQACDFSKENSEGQFDLVILDTLSVPFTGDIHAGAFSNNNGIIYNYKSGEYLKFDSLGNVLVRNTIPSQGKEGLFYVNSLKILDNGNILAKTIGGEIGLLDDQLQLVKKTVMPFQNGSLDLKRNQTSIEIYEDELVLFYPGRDNKSPYTIGYYKENHLLEMLNPNTGKAKPFLKLSPESKYQQDLHFEPPSGLISISGNSLYFVFNKEPLISRYNLGKDGIFEESIPLDSENFVQIKGQPLPLGNDGSVIAEGEITNLYALKDGFAVAYFDGLAKSNNLTNRLPGKQLKIYKNESGWSKPIALPLNILFLLNFDGEDQSFYALINPNSIPGANKDAKILKFHLQPAS